MTLPCIDVAGSRVRAGESNQVRLPHPMHRERHEREGLFVTLPGPGVGRITLDQLNP